MTELIMHDCRDHPDGHASPIEPTTSTRLGCGCTRHRGFRCDWSRIEWLWPVVCGRHQDDREAS